MVFVVFAAHTLKAFAEVKHQAGDLFWMDVPEGWQWDEDKNSVVVVSPTNSRAIYIEFEVVDGIHSDGDAIPLVQQAMASKIKEVISRNAKTIMKLERKIDGVFALQSNFLISAPEGMRQSTAVVFFKDRYLYTIYLEAPREYQRMEMEGIVDTIKFEAPKPESDEAANPPPEVANQVDVKKEGNL